MKPLRQILAEATKPKTSAAFGETHKTLLKHGFKQEEEPEHGYRVYANKHGHAFDVADELDGVHIIHNDHKLGKSYNVKHKDLVNHLHKKVGVIAEGFFGKKKSKAEDPGRFPEKHNNADWIEKKVAHARETSPKDAHHLFNPHSGDYIPTAIAASHSFSGQSQKDYHAAREKHHDLVKKAMDHNAKRGVEQQVSTSRVHGHPDDFKHLN